MAMEIRVNRVSRIYRPGEKVEGVVVIGAGKALSHSGLVLQATGNVVPQVTASTVGILESFYSAVKPVEVLRDEMMLTMDTFPEGRTEVPFEMLLEALPGAVLTETYHGVYINVVYQLTAELVRSGFSRNLEAELEFVLEVPCTEAVKPDPLDFSLTPELLGNINKSSLASIPKFEVTGRLNMQNCRLNEAFTGHITVNVSESALRSIELQLVRVESVMYAEGTAKEATEIQNLQLAEGDVSRGLTIPIYMLFPRLFTCPSSTSSTFSVEFEVNVILNFEDGYMVTENFPIVLYR